MERTSRIGSVLAAFEQTIDKNRECGGLESKNFLTGVAGEGAMIGSVTPRRLNRRLSESPGKSPTKETRRHSLSAPTSVRSPIGTNSGHSAHRKSWLHHNRSAVNTIKSLPFTPENSESEQEKAVSRKSLEIKAERSQQCTPERVEDQGKQAEVQPANPQRQIELMPNPYLRTPTKSNDVCYSPTTTLDSCTTTTGESSSLSSLESHKARQRVENVNRNSSEATGNNKPHSGEKSPKRRECTDHERKTQRDTILGSSNHKAGGRKQHDKRDHSTKSSPSSPKRSSTVTERMLSSDKISLAGSPERPSPRSRKQFLSPHKSPTTRDGATKHSRGGVQHGGVDHFGCTTPSNNQRFNDSFQQLSAESGFASPTKQWNPRNQTSPMTPLTPSLSPCKRGLRNSVFQGLDKIEPAGLREVDCFASPRRRVSREALISPKKLARKKSAAETTERRLINHLGLATPKQRKAKFGANGMKRRQMSIFDIIDEEKSMESMAMDNVESPPKFVLEHRARQMMKLQKHSAVIIQAFIRGNLLRQRNKKFGFAVRIQALVRGGMHRLKFRIALLEHRLVSAESHQKKEVKLIQLRKWKEMEAFHAKMANQEHPCETQATDIINHLKKENIKIQDQNNRINNMMGLLTQTNEQTEKATETHNANFQTIWDAVELLTEKGNKLTAEVEKYKMRIDKQMASLVALGARVKNETRVRETLEKGLMQVVETIECRSDDELLVRMIVAMSNGEYEEEETIHSLDSIEHQKEEDDISEGFFLSFCIADDVSVVSDVSSIHNERSMEIRADEDSSLEPMPYDEADYEVPYDEVEYVEEITEDEETDDEESCQSSVWVEQSILL